MATKAPELAGNPGFHRPHPYERHLRDARAVRAHAPQNHIIRTNAAPEAQARREALAEAAAREVS